MEVPSHATREVILDGIHEAVALLDHEGRFRAVNRAAERVLDTPATELVGRSVFDVMPGDEAFHAAYRGALERDEPVRFEGFSRVLGRWLDTDAHPTEDGLVVLMREVTGRHRQERVTELRESTRAALDPAQGPTDVLRSSLGALHQVTGFDVSELWTREHGSSVFSLDAAEHGVTDPPRTFVQKSRDQRLDDTSLVGQAFASGEIRTCDDLTDPEGFARSEFARVSGMRRAIALPVDVAATPDAVLCLVSSLPPDHDDWFEVLREFHPLLVDRLHRQRSLHDLERLFQLSQDVLVVARLDGFFVRVNPQLCDLLGYDEHELLGRPFTSFVHPDDLSPTEAEVTGQYQGQPTTSFVNRYRTAAGDYRILSWKSSPVPEEGIAYGVARDVTQEHLDRTFEDEQRDVLRSILTSGNLETTLDRIALALEARLPGTFVSIHLRDPDQRRLVIAAAPSMSDRYTQAVAELDIAEGVGVCGTAAHREVPVIVPDLWTDELGAGFRELAQELDLRGCWSVPFTGRDGEVLGTVAAYRSGIHDAGDEELRVTADLAHLVSLVVEKLETRRGLEESEERFRILAEATSDVIWDWDLVTDELWWSDDLHRAFGVEPSAVPTGGAWVDRIHPDDRDRITSEVARVVQGTARAWVGEYRFHRSDGRVGYVVDRGSVIRDRRGRALRMIGGMVDQTERRELEQQYLRAQRMESIGALAGGIAHDLNNVLSPIVMAADLLRQADLTDGDRETVETIGTSARRGAEMVRQVLTFARGLDGERGLVDVGALLRDLERIVRDSFLQDIELLIDPGQVALPVFGDATQIQQVLINLAINAKEAMPDGGRLVITAQEEHIGSAADGAPAGLPPGSYIRVTVEDSGVGMSPEVQDRLFEPFFTTKAAATGTGLGLPTSLAIARSHGGILEVDSELGRGSSFALWLPASNSDPGSAAPAEEQPPARGNGELIMVVDDEASVRTVTRQALEAFGYRVITAKDGADAVAQYGATNEVDLVLTDVMMPVMDGIETTRRLRELDPDACIVAVSGLTDEGRLPRAADAGACEVLSKPFSTDVLLRTVARALARPPQGR